MKINSTKVLWMSWAIMIASFFFSKSASAQLTSAAPYCTPAHIGCANGDIGSITFNTMSVSDPCGGGATSFLYWNFGANRTTTLAPGSTYNFTISVGTLGPYSGIIISVWIDYNRNNTFEPSEWFQPSTNLSSGSVTVPVTIPSGASLGLTRMRVRTRGTGNPNGSGDACTTMGSGEGRDFDVTIGFGGGSGPVLPPIANFFPSQPSIATVPTDTVWINSPYSLVSTSTNTSRSFWDLPGENPLLPGYGRSNVGWTTQQYIDTAKYDQKFKYTFNRRGFWPVRLLAVNNMKRDSLRDSVVKYIWVDTPGTIPQPNFFAARRKIGIGDYASLVDITAGGPNQWYWTFDPACNLCTTPPYFNNFFAGPTDQNPLFFGGDPGKFTICLQAWNARGWDTICKKDYIEVINSINICSGSGATKSSESQGFMFGPSGPGLSYTRSQLTGCQGFLLEPCADSIILWVDRIKMLPSDTLVIHNGTSSTAPILRKLGAANVNQLPATVLQNGIRGGSRLFVRFQTGTAAIPNPYDSAGFSIRWEIKAASYPKPTSKMVLQDTIFSLQPVTFTASSTGTLMKYSWDSDGNGNYDSSAAVFNRSFLVTTPQYKTICLVTYNCVGSDTICKNVLFLPTSQKPAPRFTVDKVQGFNTDTFRFSDMSLYGPSTWKWTFTPSTAQYLMGTTSTSKNPIMRFTQRTKYTVKLVVSNMYGSDSLIKVDYVNIGAYDQPQCLSDINLADGSIGISRVILQTGVDTSINAYSPCFVLVGGNQAANLYRGKKHQLTVSRPAATSPMDRKAWIDFNMDGMFGNDELVMNDMGGTSLTRIDTVSVSETQMLGATRMRVGVTYAGTTFNPSVTFLGVFRDYVVNFPKDTVKPVANLVGGSTYYTEIHKPYIDAGINANDNIEGNISAKYEIIGTVDTSKVGPNYLKYVVKDLYGNVSDTLFRTVFVVLNQSGPSIVLSPPSQVYVEVYNKFNEPGFIALNNQGVEITNQVMVTGNLDTSKIGQYTLTYTIIDAFGLSDVKTRTVNVGDTTKPLITPKASPYIHQVGTAIDLTKIVDVTDNYWGPAFVTLTVVGSVDVNSVGSYYITYTARDNSGNQSSPLLLEVRVRDTKPPVLVLNGTTPFDWDVKVPFVDPWVDPNDNYWPKATINVTRKGSVNVNALGEYTLWYIGTDPSGNKDSISRLVRVVDRGKPSVDLLGVTEVNLPRWQEYVDAPVSLIDNYYTDAEMRSRLVAINSLPINTTTNKPWGDAPGLYSVRYTVTDPSGNVSGEAKRLIKVQNEGPNAIGDVVNFDQLMSVYPNPSNGRIQVRLADVQDQDVQVVILDIMGKEIYKIQIKGNNLQAQEIDLSNQAKGIYFIRIQSGDHVYAKKIQIN